MRFPATQELYCEYCGDGPDCIVCGRGFRRLRRERSALWLDIGLFALVAFIAFIAFIAMTGRGTP